MKKIILFILISVLPNLANAEASASISLKNFKYTANEESEALKFFSFAGVARTMNGANSQEESLYILPDNLEFDLSSSSNSNNYTHATALATYASSNPNSSISIDTLSGGNLAWGTASVTLGIVYKANTTLTFSTDAFLTTSGQAGDNISSLASFELTNLFTGESTQSYIYNDSSSPDFSPNITKSKTLSVSFFSDKNTLLYLTGTANALILGTHVISSPVPENETYAMLLVGLGLLGFIAKRRNT